MTLIPLGDWKVSPRSRSPGRSLRNSLPRRQLVFPDDRSIGDVFFLRSTGRFKPEPTHEARGRITVPAGVQVHLDVLEDDEVALEWTARLRLGDVQSIRLISIGPAFGAVSAICHLRDLGRLAVDGDDINGTLIALIVESFPKLSALRLWDTRGWRRKATFDERSLVHVVRLKHLRLLEIASADLSDDGVALIARNAPNLRELTIDSPRVTDPGLRPLRGLSKLKVLGLGRGIRGVGLRNVTAALEILAPRFYCRLNNDGLACLTNRFRRLRSLGLVGAPVTNRGVRELWRLPKLEFADLHNVRRLSDGGLDGVEQARELRVLRVGGTRVGDDAMAQIGRLRQLVELDLDYTKVTNAGIAELSGLRKLRRLDARGIDIDNGAIGDIAKIPSLESLNCGATAVDDVSIPAFSRMSSLRSLWLCDAGVSEAGIRRLRKALPECAIVS